MAQKYKEPYYKNIIEFLKFTNTFCIEFNNELKKIDYTNKYNILFENDFYNLIIKDYGNIEIYIKIRDVYREKIYEYQKATFYFILNLLTSNIENNILKKSKKNILYNNKKLKEEDILRLIYFGFFMDELNYKIYFFDKNKKRKDILIFDGYYKYLQEYIDIFYKNILKKEINNIYKQIGFPIVHKDLKYVDIIEKYVNKKIILFTIDREILWKFKWFDNFYPLFKYNIEKNINNFSILSYLYFDNKKDKFIFKKEDIKNKIPISIVYLWIKNDNFNKKLLLNKKIIDNINVNIYENNKYGKLIKIKNINEEILNFNIINKDKLSKKKILKIKSIKNKIFDQVIVKKNIDDLNIKDVDIVTMGKVGSTTIWETLLQLKKNKYKIEHNHNLKYLKSRVDNNKNILFVMGIRNPLDINMSYFFMTCNGYSNTTEKIMKNNYLGFHNNLSIESDFQYNDLNNLKFEEIKDMFFKRNLHFFFNQWFEELFTMINLNKVKFDKKLGISFYQLPNNNILMFYILEKLNDNEKILKEFLDVNEIIKENLAEQKEYKDKYDEFKSKISFSKYYKDRLLNTDIMNHFYTKKEIESFYNKYPTSN